MKNSVITDIEIVHAVIATHLAVQGSPIQKIEVIPRYVVCQVGELLAQLKPVDEVDYPACYETEEPASVSSDATIIFNDEQTKPVKARTKIAHLEQSVEEHRKEVFELLAEPPHMRAVVHKVGDENVIPAYTQTGQG